MYYINYIINLRGFVMMKRFIKCLELKKLRNNCGFLGWNCICTNKRRKRRCIQ